MARLNLAPVGGSAIATFLILGFALGIATVWLYAAIRPRFGAGVNTALCAAAAVWFLAYVYPASPQPVAGERPAHEVGDHHAMPCGLPRADGVEEAHHDHRNLTFLVPGRVASVLRRRGNQLHRSHLQPRVQQGGDSAACPELAASSYKSVYGMLLDEARRRYVMDGIALREHSYELDGTGAGRAVSVNNEDSARGQRVIRATVAEIAKFYGYHP